MNKTDTDQYKQWYKSNREYFQDQRPVLTYLWLALFTGFGAFVLVVVIFILGMLGVRF